RGQPQDPLDAGREARRIEAGSRAAGEGVTPAGGIPPAREPAGRVLAIGLLLPLAAGAACVFGFAPFYAWIVPIATLAALFFAWTRSDSAVQAALSGFAFGLGYFLAGVS